MPSTNALSDATHAANRQAGLYICRCKQPQPDGLGECGRCHRLVVEEP